MPWGSTKLVLGFVFSQLRKTIHTRVVIHARVLIAEGKIEGCEESNGHHLELLVGRFATLNILELALDIDRCQN